MDIEAMIDALHMQGWCVWDDFLSVDEVRALYQCLPSEWSQAGVGRQDEHTLVKSIRSDKIHWLSETMGQPVQAYLEKMEAIRQAANRSLYLGLFEYEAHFAKYEEGAFYQKHRDSFRGRANRKLTTVFYLNDQDWQASDGGELVIYRDDESFLTRLTPKGGRLVVFLSEDFPHEVLPAHRKRFSIAGWFRLNGVNGASLDIAV
ncbi:2OG-Fe(II) oxygenase [Photobacterium sp. GJ3]|uniref:2OG-Fe(II) oxygenase n=1 Tax=Photobacterium sp. GJ3 TaxID=2829502 RepID=UPI001B8CF339|nr:2OG-Fe(II) oxygenase [Photobacterium sp. GJ3]QUJ68618.1 2OG-Fe(II) oxygenase [Photobacterium sp. GJ3]